MYKIYINIHNTNKYNRKNVFYDASIDIDLALYELYLFYKFVQGYKVDIGWNF
jgi:hypothetical protein